MTPRSSVAAAIAAFAIAALPQASMAQETPPETGPKVGAVAPDFSLAGATRYGLLKAPVKLSDYKGETVVLAFFFKARTRG
jgi:thioredoxin-dependent peroxiredoxin